MTRTTSTLVTFGLFTVAGTLAFTGATALMGRGGVQALVSLPLAYFAAGTLAAVILPISMLARLGFGVVLAVGGFGSFIGLVATQAMTGQESVGGLFVFFVVSLIGSYGVGAVFAWPAAYTLGRSVLFTGLVGLGGGVLLSAGLLAVMMSVFTLNIFTAQIPLSLPAAVGAASVAWALGGRSKPATAG